MSKKGKKVRGKTPGRAAAPGKTISISLCLITRNEAANLPRLLDSVQGLVDEIVIADTGSTDETVAIAHRYGARVIYFPWCDDFSAAKNAALQAASGSWILHLDADMEVLPGQGARIRQAVASGAGRAYRLLIRSPHARQDQVELVAQSWLFVNHPAARFRGAVHESILPSLVEIGIEPVNTGIVVEHYGYIDPGGLQARWERNVRILQRGLEQAGSPIEKGQAYFNLGRSYVGLHQYPEALQALQMALDACNHPWSVLADIHAMMAQLRFKLYGAGPGMQAAANLLERFPGSRECCTIAGNIYQAGNDFGSAIQAYKAGLQADPLAGVDAVIHEISDGRLALELGRCFFGLSDWPAAITWLKQAGDVGDPKIAWLLGQAALQTGDDNQAAASLQAVLVHDPSHAGARRLLDGLAARRGSQRLETLVNRARQELGMAQYQQAIASLKQVQTLQPDRVGINNDLGACYAMAGDLNAAVAAFARELSINPRSDQAMNNIGLLQQRLGNYAEAVKCFEQALIFNPENQDASRNLQISRQATLHP